MSTRTARSVASGRSPSSLSSPRPAASAPGRLRLVSARTGDHTAIHRLLRSVFHGPSLAEFQAQLDEPGYDPANRWIVKDGEQIAAHLRLARQAIHIGSAALPATRFMDVATAPEYRGKGLASALLAAGERAAAERGVLVGLTRTRVPSLFARAGWSVCGEHCFSTAAPRPVLAELAAQSATDAASESAAGWLLPRTDAVSVRPLRRIELGALIRLYDQAAVTHCGWPLRDSAYWEWLFARGACDRAYVATSSAETAGRAALDGGICGYALVRQARMVELVTSPGRTDVARELVRRVCADATEQDEWLVRCDAPAAHPVHSLLATAGGRLTVARELNGEWFMAKLLDPLAALRALAPLLARRAADSGLTLPCELGIELRNSSAAGLPAIALRSRAGVADRFRVLIGSEEASIEIGGLCRHGFVLHACELPLLILGAAGAEALLARGAARAPTPKARLLADALFPGGAWWRPPLDDLLA
jgi:GNAT superfamily N-acetyltransferase